MNHRKSERMAHDTTPAVQPVTSDMCGRPPAARSSRGRLAVVCMTLVASAALLSACGDNSSEDAAADKSASPSHSMATDKMDGMAMGDPSAVPADKVPGAEVVKGQLELLETRPPGMDDVKGTAWLAQGPKGSTVTVSLTGLKPGAAYMAHLHAKHCADGNGGPHFQFEKGGATMPPNEVHLMFTADPDGKGMTTVNNARKTGADAVALVVHPREAMDNRIACADFDF
ncbi:superoxide dismutase family protein [Streptomyces sp. NPDC048577]|uniref:superoxide dismutase family protein n=1 Tax=Streptomyces sp. NPDC048577 TaxID=3157209 RepID=UPI0034355145